MNDCDCKHANYCKLDPKECTLENEWKHFNQDKIINMSTKQVSSLQGRPEADLK